jgi:hypothetical protein
MINYYQLLEILDTATTEEIAAAYAEQRIIWQPESAAKWASIEQQEDCKEIYAQIEIAGEILQNKITRQHYDKKLFAAEEKSEQLLYKKKQTLIDIYANYLKENDTNSYIQHLELTCKRHAKQNILLESRVYSLERCMLLLENTASVKPKALLAAITALQKAKQDLTKENQELKWAALAQENGQTANANERITTALPRLSQSSSALFLPLQHTSIADKENAQGWLLPPTPRVHFSKAHEYTLQILTTEYELSRDAAMCELKGLSASLALKLAHLYQFGFTGNHLRSFKPAPNALILYPTDDPFNQHHANALQMLRTPSEQNKLKKLEELRQRRNFKEIRAQIELMQPKYTCDAAIEKINFLLPLQAQALSKPYQENIQNIVEEHLKNLRL